MGIFGRINPCGARQGDLYEPPGGRANSNYLGSIVDTDRSKSRIGRDLESENDGSRTKHSLQDQSEAKTSTYKHPVRIGAPLESDGVAS